MIEDVIERWHQYLRQPTPEGLRALLADDVVFYSPIVYTPQRGAELTARYLAAATRALPGDGATGPGTGGGSFRYTKTVAAGDTAVLEFETTIGGTYVNGVDIIRCDADGRIVEFRVMVRPLQAVHLVHRQMAEALGLPPPD